MIVRENINFDRSGPITRKLGIGIVTWEKLQVGDILQNKEVVYILHPSAISLIEPKWTSFRKLLPPPSKNFFTITEIKIQGEYLDMWVSWTNMFTFARRMRNDLNESIQQYQLDGEITTLREYFDILQPRDYES